MKRVLAAIAVAAITTTTAWSQDIDRDQPTYFFTNQRTASMISFDFLGAGARAQGMGHAYLGISDDITAGTWNPAGLIVHEKPMLGVSYGMFQPRGKFEGRALLDHSGNFGSASYLGFVVPTRIRGHQFVGSVTYARALDEFDSQGQALSFLIPFLVFNPNGNLETELLPSDFTYTRTGRSAPELLSFAFGTRIRQDFSMGLGINVYLGKYISRADQLLSVNDTFPINVGTVVIRGDLFTSTTWYDTSRYSGVNFTIAGKYKKNKLSVGMVIKTPFDLGVKADSSIFTRTYVNGVERQNTGFFIDDQLIKYQMPFTIATGVGYQLTEKLLVAGDLEYRPFAGKVVRRRTEIKILGGNNIEETYVDFDPTWFNAIALRMGGEYIWTTGSTYFPTVPLRAGFSYSQIPTPSFDTPTEPTPIDQLGAKREARIGLAMGAGVRWSQVHLDFAYMYTMSNRTTQFLNVTSLDPDQQEYVVPTGGETKERNHGLTLTFTGYF